VKSVPREEWSSTTVGKVATRCSGGNTIAPDADAMEAISIMKQGDLSRLMVAKNSQLVGVITLKDLLRFLSVKIELDEPRKGL
jgi:predicted transcriptional regulator